MEVLQRTANRGSISTGYDIDNSLKLEADDSQYIDDRHYTAGNRKKLTISFWFKRTELGQTQMPYEQSALQARIYLRSTDDLYITAYDNSGWTIITNRLFRDPSAWYHCVFQLDTTQSTAADRMKLWINGQQETSFSSASYPTQNADTFFNTNQSAKVGGGGAGLYFSGYMSEFFFIDDQALQASDFGEYDSDSGIWIPKEYDGTFGGQSYYLEFKNASNLADRSDGLSNGVSLSVQNITSADQATDTPTNNFSTCTYGAFPGNTNLTITEGGTKVTTSAGGLIQYDMNFSWYSNILAPYNSGKWYIEVYVTAQDAGVFGIAPNQGSILAAPNNNWDRRVYLYNGSVYYNYSGSSGVDSSRFTFTTGDILMAVIDADNQRVTFGKNGGWMDTSSGVTNSSPAVWYTYSGGDWDEYGGFVGFYGTTALTNTNPDWEVNHGGYHTYTISSAATDENGYGTFEYAPPSGYYALCTKNLAEYG